MVGVSRSARPATPTLSLDQQAVKEEAAVKEEDLGQNVRGCGDKQATEDIKLISVRLASISVAEPLTEIKVVVPSTPPVESHIGLGHLEVLQIVELTSRLVDLKGACSCLHV